MATDNEYLLKINLVGNSDTLKTHFVQAFAENQFPPNHLPTLGVDITTKKISVDDIQVKLILVVTSGQEFFGKHRPSYYRGASALIIIFDKNDRQSFMKISTWKEEFDRIVPPPQPKISWVTGYKKEISPPPLPIALVGILTPPNEASDVISTYEAQELATQLKMRYFEFPLTDRHQVSKLFLYLSNKVIEAGSTY